MRAFGMLTLLLSSAFYNTAGAQQAYQAYPIKPIRWIVPIAAGSVSDVIARATARELASRLGQNLVIDNRAGATGIIGAELCARAVPDGYTLCNIYSATTSINPHVIAKLPYDPARDFKAVSNLYFVTGALVAVKWFLHPPPACFY